MTIIKRTGEKATYDEMKIYNALYKAFEEVDGGVSTEDEEIIKNIVKEITNDFVEEGMKIEDIQDIVEDKLMESKRKDVARAYIRYRYSHQKEREKEAKIVKLMKEKFEAMNIVNSNANVDEASFSGREKEAATAAQKEIVLDDLLPKDVAKAHRDMLIYQHDLEKETVGEHNCLNLDFQAIFGKDGFMTRNGGVRQPRSFSTACQLVAVAFQAQSQCQFGGVGSIHIDYDLSPFVKMSFKKHFKKGLKYVEGLSEERSEAVLRSENVCLDNDKIEILFPKAYAYAVDMLEEEGFQSCQGLYHNLNTLESRPGSQLPFTSINLGRDTSTEGRLVSKWIMQASLDGIGKHHLTSIFPISIFQYKQGVNANPEDPNYDLKQLALKSMSKRIYPNWVNGDWSQAHEDPDDIDTFMSTINKTVA